MPFEEAEEANDEEDELEMVRELLPEGYEILEVITVEDKEEEENENALDSPIDPRQNEVLGANNG